MTLPALPAQGVPVPVAEPTALPVSTWPLPGPTHDPLQPPGTGDHHPAATSPPIRAESAGTSCPFAPSTAKTGFVRLVLIGIQMGWLFISDAGGTLPRASASPHRPPRGGDAPSGDPAQDCGFTPALTPQTSAQAAASILPCLLLSLSLHSQRYLQPGLQRSRAPRDQQEKKKLLRQPGMGGQWGIAPRGTWGDSAACQHLTSTCHRLPSQREDLPKSLGGETFPRTN